MPEPRIILRIDITPRAAKRLGAICERFGSTQLSVISRLVEWYDQLPDEVRYAVIGLTANTKQSSRAILEHMMGKEG